MAPHNWFQYGFQGMYIRRFRELRSKWLRSSKDYSRHTYDRTDRRHKYTLRPYSKCHLRHYRPYIHLQRIFDNHNPFLRNCHHNHQRGSFGRRSQFGRTRRHHRCIHRNQLASSCRRHKYRRWSYLENTVRLHNKQRSRDSADCNILGHNLGNIRGQSNHHSHRRCHEHSRDFRHHIAALGRRRNLAILQSKKHIVHNLNHRLPRNSFLQNIRNILHNLYTSMVELFQRILHQRCTCH